MTTNPSQTTAPGQPTQTKKRELIGGRFLNVRHLGEGTYGSVFASRDTKENTVVALKKVKVRNASEGIDPGTIQEIRQLAELDHPNIVRYIGAFPHQGSLYIATEYIASSLTSMIHPMDKKNTLSPSDVKCIMKQFLLGIKYLHDNWILHRDIKPDNIMITENGVVKLIDFGLACDFPSDFHYMMPQAMTYWYRPPELFFGSSEYGPAADMWSVGCVFGEMILSRPVFAAETDYGVVQNIANILGAVAWPGCDKLPNYAEINPQGAVPSLRDIFKGIKDDGLDLISKLLEIDPSKRITAAEALRHAYFSCAPEATIPTKLPIPESSNKASNLSRLTGLTTSFLALTGRTIYAPGTTLVTMKQKKE